MNYKQVVNNAKWIIICRAAQSIIQLLVGMLCARYLGPSNYGLINYAAAILNFALPIMKLGLNATLVHRLIESPEKEGEIMGTSLLMNLVSSFVCILGISTFVSVLNNGEPIVITVCILYSLSLVFSALEMIQYWFQYKLLSKYSSIVMLLAYVVVSLYKIFLLVTSKSVYWFALVNSLDYGIISISLLILYFRLSGKRFSFSFDMAKRLFSVSKHYILSSMMVVVFHSTDHVMITNMVGEDSTGYYSAAVTCTSVVQFVYVAIIDSFRPLILQNKKENSPEYEKNISGLYSIIIYLSLAQSIVFTIFAGLIINILYGSAYASAVPILRVLVWYLAFSFMGSVRDVWILAEGKQKYLWMINIMGAGFNVVLNAALIPFFGAMGAATASLFTQIFTNFILGFILKPMRRNNIIMLKGLNPKFLISEGKKCIGLLLKK